VPDIAKPAPMPAPPLTEVQTPPRVAAVVQNAAIFCVFLLILCLAMLGSLLIVHRLIHRWNRAKRGVDPEALISTDKLRAGQTVQVEIERGRSGRWRGRARIEAIQKNGLCLATLPGCGGFSAANAIMKGAPLQVLVEGDTAAFQFYAGLQDWQATGETTTFYIDRPLWMAKVQRREYFRVPLREPTMLSTLGGRPEESRRLRALLENVSGGGCSLNLTEPLEAGTCVRLQMPSGSLEGFSFEARILRCLPRLLSGDLPYQAQCEFLPFSEETRCLLVAYCFEQERARRADRGRS
jgi:c-di-GMP-binding flagellar brake protein YcgR